MTKLESIVRITKPLQDEFGRLSTMNMVALPFPGGRFHHGIRGLGTSRCASPETTTFPLRGPDVYPVHIIPRLTFLASALRTQAFGLPNETPSSVWSAGRSVSFGTSATARALPPSIDQIPVIYRCTAHRYVWLLGV